jgi:predicted transcriptional regulator
LSGWLAEEALHPDVRRMEGEPDRIREKAANTEMGRFVAARCLALTGQVLIL